MRPQTTDDRARDEMDKQHFSLPRLNKYAGRAGTVQVTVHIDKRPDSPLFLVSVADMAEVLDYSQKAMARACDVASARIKLGRPHLYGHDGPFECLDLRDWRNVALGSSDLKHKSGRFRDVLNAVIGQLTEQYPARRPEPHQEEDEQENEETMSTKPLPDTKAIDLPRPKVFKIVSVNYDSALVLEALKRLDRRIAEGATIKITDGEASVEWEESEG